ncbi:ferric iron reductase [Pararhizobium antarcticum]|uniref:Ferric siderophore reductase C-terminal domain-containing protein n=1 Tax=Pararhizobium antarcticum TaxID=1798805 RepID=A0A657LVN4_9HYPH|nr:ferric iron reductase [Pararhizobium antarcticum]OJF93295.1 hypothetical protein AX761_20300 [Rhizobium sp. 58]OJF99537.1 hypothetical protein AX760_12350 [Pararhizobium antarcticum]
MVKDRQSGIPAQGEFAVAIAWLAHAFPQSAFSLGPVDKALGEEGPVRDGFSPASSAFDVHVGQIDTYLAYQTRFAEGMDERTRAAHLIALYSHQFSAAVVCVYLRTGRVPDMDPQRILIRFEAVDRSEMALPLDVWRFHIRSSGHVLPATDDSLGVFHDEIVAHLRPVIDALKRKTGFSTAAQWRLAADSLAGAFLDLGQALGCEAEAIGMALALVGREGSPLASPALRFETIKTVVDGRPVEKTFRLRGGCCLFYRTAQNRFCDNCVLLDADSQRSRLRDFVRGSSLQRREE